MGKEGKTGRSQCSTACTLEIIGDRWSLLLIRDFVFRGCREYNDFLSSPEKISTNILANRLKWLVENKMFIKYSHPTNKKKYFYEITDKGFDLIVIIMELAKWGWSHIPRTYSPPEAKKSYLADPKKFMKDWKKEAQKQSQEYLRKASSGSKLLQSSRP